MAKLFKVRVLNTAVYEVDVQADNLTDAMERAKMACPLESGPVKADGVVKVKPRGAYFEQDAHDIS